MDRTTARICAMKLIYEWEMGGDGGEDTRLNLLEIEPDENEVLYMEEIVRGVTEHQADIDEIISKYSRGWSTDRMNRVDLAILRLAVYEIMYRDLPSPVAINEAVEMANQFSTDKAGGFINGILGNLQRLKDNTES